MRALHCLWIPVFALAALPACGGCTAVVSDEDGGGTSSGQSSGDGGGLARVDGGTSGGTSGTSGASGSSGSSGASGGSSGGSSGFVSGCTATERCGDGLDNNCNNTVDENCGCVPGDSQPCYVGDPAHAGVGICTKGTMNCEPVGEDGEWGACTGSVAPQGVQCGSGVDYTCTGDPDYGCACHLGAMRDCYTGAAGTSGVGVCHGGSQTCVNGSAGPEWSTCAGEVTPSAETCDGADHDCNGTTNDGCACTLGATQACYTGPAGTNGVGLCHGGTQECLPGGSGPTWSPCNNEVIPTAEACDGADHNCNGTPNDGCGCTVGQTQPCYSGPAGTSGVGQCHGGTQTCQSNGGSSAYGTCDGEVTPAADSCDGVDRDCDGNPLTNCACQLGASQACYEGPAGTQGVGICHAGTQACVASGGGATWGTCSGQQTPGAVEICGNGLDDNCANGVDENCEGLQCPADITIPAGTPATLTASGTGITSYSWAITAQPGNAGSSAEWTPAPPNQASVQFRPYIVGVYTLTVTGRDAQGRTYSCEVHVTAQAHGLRVELSWNGAGDVDLHLHNGTNTFWFNPDDCYYGNCIPPPTIYGQAGPRPWGSRLDVDNVTADGPENINMDTPAIGERYTIGVHNYTRAAGRTPVVKVYCGLTGNGLVPQQTFTGRALNGADNGPCTANDFWRVADITFTAAGVCTITNVDRYTESNDACANR
ncbi:MAG: hypothetical protein HY904_08225 [Deltaproteobacteria bacterium]|nr:hypothetical protein [Deltaproteobacteria bacterium]